MPSRPSNRERSVSDPNLLGDTNGHAAKVKGLDPASKTRHRFIVCSTTTGKLSDLETKKAIRRHVMQGLPRLRKPHDLNRIEIYIPPSFLEVQPPPIDYVTLPFSSPDVATDDGTQSTPPLTRSPSLSPSSPESLDDEDAKAVSPRISRSCPVSILGQGRVDPLANYPINMNTGEQWLIDQVTVAHHSIAIRCVSSKLSDPVLRISDSVLASIATFVCYSVVLEDFRALALHLDGLDEAIALREGLDALETNRALAALVYGVDISGATRQDSRPRFPLREKFLRSFKGETAQELEYQSLFIKAPAGWKRAFPPGHKLHGIFTDLAAAIGHTTFKSAKKQHWRDVDFILYWIDPIIHQLLCMRSELAAVQEELCRLGIILFMGPIRRNCGKLGVSSTLYVQKLKALLSVTQVEVDLNSNASLLLWALFFGMLETWRLPEQGWYVSSVSLTAKGLGLDSWDEIIESVSSFLWMESIFEADLERFRDVVTLCLQLA